MTWQRFLIGWVVVACVVAPLTGQVLRRRRLELEAAEVWAGLPKLDQPDPKDETLLRFTRTAWNKGNS